MIKWFLRFTKQKKRKSIGLPLKKSLYLSINFCKNNRFPYNGFVNAGKQAKKAEDVKRRFGIQNSIFMMPNEIPKFEYNIKTTPQLFSKAEYLTKIECDVEDPNAPTQYRINLFPAHLPSTSTVSIKLIGDKDTTDFIRLSDHKIILRERDIGKVRY